jgi:hypothetical protein
MRHHVEAEVAGAGISVVTEADVRRMLARFGELQEPSPSPRQESTARPPSGPSRENKSAPDPVPTDVVAATQAPATVLLDVCRCDIARDRLRH